jgi:hypothetical protein
MGLEKISALFKRKPKPRPIYVGDQIVGWDDGLPNSINIDRLSLINSIIGRPINSTYYWSLYYLLRLPSEYPEPNYEYADIGLTGNYCGCVGVSTGGAYLQVRGRRNKKWNYAVTFYWLEIAVARASSDFAIWKTVMGSSIQLATEAVDLPADAENKVLLQVSGTTLKAARSPTANWHMDPDIAVPSGDFKITTTDTSIASGMVNMNCMWARYTPTSYWGAQSYWMNAWTPLRPAYALIRPPSSPSPEPLAYFEVPIEEFHLPDVNDDGTLNLTTDFYGIKLPEEIAVLEKPIPEHIRRKREILERKGWSEEEIRVFLPEAFPAEKVNRLAVTWSALIPTDKSGKPVNGTAIVRVFESTPEYCHPIEKRIQAIEEMRGVRRLKREEAIDLALKMDDKLHIHDLVPCTKHELGGKCFREYREWRIGSVDDKPEFADTDIRKHYVKETKGW